MRGFVRRVRLMLADPVRVMMCESCGSVCACDTGCRAGAARERVLTGYLSAGFAR